MKAVPSCVNENDTTKNNEEKTSSGEHTVISNQNAVTSTPPPEQKLIVNGSPDFDPTAVKSSTPINPAKPPAPTEVINPMTFSIMPSSASHLAHTTENDRKSEAVSEVSDPIRDVSTNSNPADIQAQPTNVEVLSAEPVADLMMFSLTPSAVARIRSTPAFPSQGQGQILQTTPASQPDLSKISEVAPSTDDDLIEFSIYPNLVRNAHDSKSPYDFSTASQGSRSSSISPLPPRERSPGMHPPELRTSRRSPELSRYLQNTGQQGASSQDQGKNQEVSSTNSAAIGEPQRTQKMPTPPFQRQTSFPFQNKQPAVLQSKIDIHALPQSSDFANQFPALNENENTSKGDLLKPDWEHFAESDEASEFFSTSPERWTVLTATGEEEATFKAERQFSEDFVSTTTSNLESDERTASSEATNEEMKFTPAITSLKRVANYAPETPKSVSPVAGRPLPSIPCEDSSHSHTTTSQPTALLLRDNERGLPTSLGSPMAHLSPNSTTAKFLAHPNHSQSSSNAVSSTISSSNARPSATKAPSSSTYDPLYIDPDELIFSKPTHFQSQTTASSYGQKRHDITGKLNAQVRESSSDRENYIEVETVTDKVTTSSEQPVSTKESSKDREFFATNKTSSDGRKSATGGSAADKNSDFSSPPITADPLYALPEKLKLKFASQGAITHASKTTAESSTTPTESITTSSSSITSVSSASSSSVGQRPSKPVTTGAEYLNLLLQERQSTRQQNSANLTTPTGDLLEASTKARAGSNIDLSPTTVATTISIGGSTVSTASLKTRHRSGKEYLAELLQRKARQQSAQSSNVGLAGQTPRYTTSNSNTSVSGGSNLRHTAANESRFSASQPAYTGKQSSSASSMRSTVQPSYRNPNPVGPGRNTSGAVPSKQYMGAGNVQRTGRVTDTVHKTTSEVASQGQFIAQKRTQEPGKAFLTASFLSPPLPSFPSSAPLTILS